MNSIYVSDFWLEYMSYKTVAAIIAISEKLRNNPNRTITITLTHYSDIFNFKDMRSCRRSLYGGLLQLKKEKVISISDNDKDYVTIYMRKMPKSKHSMISLSYESIAQICQEKNRRFYLLFTYAIILSDVCMAKNFDHRFKGKIILFSTRYKAAQYGISVNALRENLLWLINAGLLYKSQKVLNLRGRPISIYSTPKYRDKCDEYAEIYGFEYLDYRVVDDGSRRNSRGERKLE